MDLKDFILDFYKVYHVSQMDSGRAERWRDLRGKPETGEWNSQKNEFNWLDDKRSPAMKKWENKATGDLYTIDDLPGSDKLDDDEWKRFYTIVRTALRNIDANRADLTRADPENPLAIDRFFGDKSFKAFSPFEPDSKVVGGPLKALGEMLENPAMAGFANWLESAQAGTGYKIFTEKPTLRDFINALKTGKYDINKGIPGKIKEFLSNLQSWLNPTWGSSQIALFPHALAELQKLFGNNGEKIEVLQIALDSDNEKIDPQQLAQFKHPKYYKEILKALYASDKPDKKSPFNNQFANAGAGAGEITGWMAESVTGANDYETALIPKLEDEKNWRETQLEKITDWRDEHLKRLYDRSARHVYIEPNAASVVAAILKEKVSPTDGVLKILEKKDAIIKRVKAKQPSASKGVDFMFEALEYIKNSGDMDDALAGCFRNGAKAQAVAWEVMKYAMAKNKVNDAKVALETLAVMRYDTLSSAHWAELKKNPIKPFEGATFMKSEPVKFVLNAATMTLNLGLAGAYWTGVVGRNLIQRGRAEIPDNKIKSFDIGRIELAMKKINRDTEEFMSLEDAQEELIDAQNALKSFETAHKSVLDQQKDAERLQTELEKAQAAGDFAMAQQKGAELATATKKLGSNADVLKKYEGLVGTERAIRSEVDRLKKNKERGEKGETDHRKYSPPKSPAENMQMLMAFWNAANGYTELSVNSYNPFKNIKAVRKKSYLKNDFEKYFANRYQNAA